MGQNSFHQYWASFIQHKLSPRHKVLSFQIHRTQAINFLNGESHRKRKCRYPYKETIPGNQTEIALIDEKRKQRIFVNKHWDITSTMNISEL